MANRTVESDGSFRMTRHPNYGTDTATGLPRVKLECILCPGDTYVPDDPGKLRAAKTSHVDCAHPAARQW